MGCCSSEPSNVSPENADDTNGRKCTDVFWLCVYILFWFVMIVIATFSFVYGSPLRIVNGYDSFGNTCGTKNNKRIGNLEMSGIDTADKPYLLFFDLKELRHSLKICVNKCPETKISKIEDFQTYYWKSGNNLCKYGFDFKHFSNNSIKDKNMLSSPFGPCPVLPVYKSKPILNRCVPKSIKDLAEGLLSNIYELLNHWDFLEQILRDLYSTWKHILGLTFLALLFSLMTISLLHLLAHLVTYIIMVLVTVACVAGTAFLWYTYFDIKRGLDSADGNYILMQIARNETAFCWFSIIATIITIIILILIFILYGQAGFLAELFKDTTKCIMQVPGLFLQPLATFGVMLVFFCFWVTVVLCLATAYYPGTTAIDSPLLASKSNLAPTELSSTNVGFVKTFSNESVQLKKFTVVEFVDPLWVKYMWWIYLIGLIWTSEFIMACQQMVIAGAVAHWFYRNKYKDDSHISYAIGKLIKYHLGSVALGSLLITIVKIPRLILTVLRAKLQKYKDEGSECAKCLLNCCICCFYCLEKFIRYLNHNAYTVIAIDGSSFCPAAKTAFEVLTQHALQVATINTLGDFILFLGKCLVTALTGVVGLYLFRKNPDLTFYAAPTLLVCVFAFFVAHCILSLYEMVLDTVYLCKCQSEESSKEMQLQELTSNDKNGKTSMDLPDAELQPIKE
ncbi:CTL-like protein 1 [Agrilus planipennis]|uniref:Choline transporter-like protein n=1 Tax=Agrilus planipennis TaxID=224129 RepID=A0A1W4WXJ2_AGRPL|nr:CTL-like protein 1 [Agrilus planipennis]